MLKKNPLRILRGGKGPVALMKQKQMWRALIRAIILERNNGKTKPFPCWGWEKPSSMYVLRARRLRIAEAYARRYEPVSALIFKRHLPQGKNWKGIRLLIPVQIVAGTEQIACTLPYQPVFKPGTLK